MHATLPLMRRYAFPAVRRGRLETLQVNLGYRCNQSCLHCHVNAGPNRSEQMSAQTITDVLAFIEIAGVKKLDLTGGAPELNAHFRDLVLRARELGVHVMDRCNLTILEEPGQEGLAEFLAGQRVEVIASLPCYQEANVDRQRGGGVFEKSLRALARASCCDGGRGAAAGSAAGAAGGARSRSPLRISSGCESTATRTAAAPTATPPGTTSPRPKRLPPISATGCFAAHNSFCSRLISVRPGQVSTGSKARASGTVTRSLSRSSGNAMTTGPGRPLQAAWKARETNSGMRAGSSISVAHLAMEPNTAR